MINPSQSQTSREGIPFLAIEPMILARMQAIQTSIGAEAIKVEGAEGAGIKCTHLRRSMWNETTNCLHDLSSSYTTFEAYDM